MDDELKALLLAELQRHGRDIEETGTASSARRAAHALKGSFGMAGERDLSGAFARVERRLSTGDEGAIVEIRDLVFTLVDTLAQGRPLPKTNWPEPPSDLRSMPLDDGAAPDYLAAVHDRIARIDAALSDASEGREAETLREIFREVHTIKGSALGVGDEIMAWFCHGLEDRLRMAQTPDLIGRVLDEVASYQSVLAEIVDAPDHALVTLRLLAGVVPPPASRPPLATPLPLPPRRPSFEVPSDSEHRGLSDDGTVRVSSATLDSLFERVGQIGQLRGPLADRSGTLLHGATSVRELHDAMREALRMIGPPRPWGAPAAAIEKLEHGAHMLLPLAAVLDASAERLGALGARISRDAEGMLATVTSMRTSRASVLFERIAAAAQAEARREGKSVSIVISGGETPLDRRLLDGLVEPIRQLTRNAVVHGLERTSARVQASKPEVGVVRLSALQRSGSLVLTVEDDGAGVDSEAVRQQAIAAGIFPEDVIRGLSETAVLTLLFFPGFTMQKGADLLAGRGVGLDLTLAAVHRLGGTIQLESLHGQGLTATITVPAEGALVRVVWVSGGGATFALPLQHTGAIRLAQDVEGPLVPLSRLIAGGESGGGSTRFAVEVLVPIEGARAPFHLGVDAVGPVDEVALRALAPWVRAVGPFGAAIVWGDDLRFSLDPLRLHQMVRTGMQG